MQLIRTAVKSRLREKKKVEPAHRDHFLNTKIVVR